MQRILCLFKFILLLNGCASVYEGLDSEIVKRFKVEPGQILAIVKVKDVEYTGEYPYECDPDTCIPFYFWFAYKAKVLEIVAGNYDKPEINFLNLQHTYFIDEVTQKWYVLLGENTGYNKAKFGYVVLKHESGYLR